jgi:hypothetical protein
MPVVESPAASTVDVTSAAAGVGMTAAPEADKVVTSAPPAAEGEGGDRRTSGLQEEPLSRGIFTEGIEAVDDEA